MLLLDLQLQNVIIKSTFIATAPSIMYMANYCSYAIMNGMELQDLQKIKQNIVAILVNYHLYHFNEVYYAEM